MIEPTKAFDYPISAKYCAPNGVFFFRNTGFNVFTSQNTLVSMIIVFQACPN